MRSTLPTNTMIPYGKQELAQDDIDAVLKVLKSDFLTQGPAVAAFEEELAAYCGAKYAVVYSSGTAALHGACHAAGVAAGDEVITSAVTFVASANCVLYQGATVKFSDIDPKSAQITLATLLPHVTPKTRAVIPVDLCGYPGDLPQIFAWAQKQGVAVIRDASHSLGASYIHQGQTIKVGSCTHADMCTLSFHPVKSITSGEGGAVTTNDERLYEKLKMFRHHGITKDPQKFVATEYADKPWYYEMQDLGYNYRLSDIHCELGRTQLKRIDAKIDKRRELVQTYQRELDEWVQFLACDDNDHKSAHHILPIQVLADQRDHLMIELKKQGIGTQLHYIPIYHQPYYQKHFNFVASDFPSSEAYFKSSLSLPLYPTLSADDQKQVIQVLKNFIRK